MLKQKIIEILKEGLPDTSQETLEYVADRIIETLIPAVAEAIANYENAR